MIQSVLDNAVGDVEILPVIDGYELKQSLPDDYRVKPVFNPVNVGMRESINLGIAASTGEFVMRSDEHCAFGYGFDRELTNICQSNWIMVPRRYFLDPVKWSVMDVGYVDYEDLKIVQYGRGRKFSGVPWLARTKERKHILVDETRAMQGSCWVMPRKWWDKVIGSLQTEGYGTHIQDSHEMVFKTWKAGGKLMLNKATWYAHKHRKFPRTHGYGGEAADKGYAYALSVWEDYYNELREQWAKL